MTISSTSSRVVYSGDGTKSSFDFAYRVTGEGGRLVAEAETTQVCYDWAARASKPISPERRAEIERFEASFAQR